MKISFKMCYKQQRVFIQHRPNVFEGTPTADINVNKEARMTVIFMV